jgi:hypothetical protein
MCVSLGTRGKFSGS